MKNYKILLSREEIEKIYWISDKEDTQSRLMSILAYYKKHSENGVLKYSVNKLHKMYVRYHNSITKSYFYTLINKIKDVFFTTVEETFEETFEEIEKVALTIENTSLEGCEEKPNNKCLNNTYTYTNNTDSKESVCTDDLVKIANGLFKEYGIKSFSVKQMVLSKLKNCNNVNIQGAIAYVTKVVTEKKGIQENKRAMFLRNKFDKPSFSKNAYKATTKELRFNNFTAREYDYEDLEKRLLEWY